MMRNRNTGLLQAGKMQAAVTVFILLGLVSALFVSCGRAEEPLLAPLGADEISAERLWERLTSESNFQDYSFWPGHEDLQLGQSPHGAFHRVYVNLQGIGSLDGQDGLWDEGTIIVKENYDIDEVLQAYTVMAKVDGYDEENGNWFWAAYGPDGAIRAEGQLMSCIVCHAGAVDNDYVIIGRPGR